MSNICNNVPDEEVLRDILSDHDLCWKQKEVLEKVIKQQTSKRVKHYKGGLFEWSNPWRCPHCDADVTKVEFYSASEDVIGSQYSYCWACGGKIDWGKC